MDAADLLDQFLGETRGPGRTGEGTLLITRNLSVAFGGVRAVDEVTIDVARGEVVALIGPNGAGKTTLLNAVTGLLRRNLTGEILLGGTSIAHESAVRVAALGVSRSFQHPPLLEEATTIENLLVGCHLTMEHSTLDQLLRPGRVRRREREAGAHAELLLAALGLEQHAHRTVSELAYGARKLVDIARSLARRPDLLLLDEPTSGLDAAEQEVVRSLIDALSANSGITLLVVEHHMDVVRQCADRVVALQAGAVIAQGSADEVLDSAAFQVAALGRRTSPRAEGQ